MSGTSKKFNIDNELFVRALFEEACASQGLKGDKVEEAAEYFISVAVEQGIGINFPKGTHLTLGFNK